MRAIDSPCGHHFVWSPGKGYFRRWLQESIDALRIAAHENVAA